MLTKFETKSARVKGSEEEEEEKEKNGGWMLGAVLSLKGVRMSGLADRPNWARLNREEYPREAG